jgi:hypothetical protein
MTVASCPPTSTCRSKVVTDVVVGHSPEWLQFIKEQLLHGESGAFATYQDSYIETPYSKGTGKLL